MYDGIPQRFQSIYNDHPVRKEVTFITLDNNGDNSVVKLRMNTSRPKPCVLSDT